MRVATRQLLMIMAGAALAGFGVNYFTIANGLGEGGFTGITILLKYWFDWSPGITSFLLNLPLFFLGWWYLGKRAMGYTIWGTVCFSFFLWLFEDFGSPIEDDLLLASLYAGVTVGIGLGIIFRYGGTTGGVDILARLAKKYLGWSMGRTMFTFDFFVIAASFFYLGREKAMYTLVLVFVAARVIDVVQEGLYAAKAAMIISNRSQEISRQIVEQMDRGTTLLSGKGGYTQKEKEIVYVVVSRPELVRLKGIIQQVDPHAFVVISDARNVLGEGFYREES
ncbi:MAG: hypothetical protein A6D91_06895 [Bacillaceae bacterium G1]|nr:hypothetical protein [Bacillota bacterium]OJF18165.1 MAG: hypothetical protein A6D91_06895 [Bacillaceae bacterium G1]